MPKVVNVGQNVKIEKFPPEILRVQFYKTSSSDFFLITKNLHENFITDSCSNDFKLLFENFQKQLKENLKVNYAKNYRYRNIETDEETGVISLYGLV